MTLENLIKEINTTSEDLIIFQKDELGIDSEIALFDEGEGINVILIKDGVTYHYLLEISIAREIMEDWVTSLKSKPSDGEIAQRLYEYAINDA